MKKLPFILIGIIILLASCNKRYSTNPDILKAESLLEDSTERALEILLSIPNKATLPKADRAAWDMHYTHAIYKLDSIITTDSLICFSLDYYTNSNLHEHAGKAYYLQGCIAEMRNEYDEAMFAFKQAESKLLKTESWNLLGLVYYKTARLYSFDEVFDKAQESFKRAGECFSRANHLKNEAFAYRDLANATDNAKGNVDSVILYFEKARKMALQAGDTANFYDTTFDLSITLLHRASNYSKAKNLLLDVYRYYDNDPYYYNKISLAYGKLNQADSALYYFKKALPDTATIYSKVATLLAGANAAKAGGDFQNAFSYLAEYDVLRNKIVADTRKAQLYRIDKRYDFSEKERENAELKITNRNMIIQIGVLVLAILMVAIVLLSLQIKRKKEQTNYQLERQKLLSEIEKKRLLLLSKLQSRIDITLRFHKLRGKLTTGKNTPEEFVDEMLKQVILNEDEWQSYIDEVNLIFNNHLQSLVNLFPVLTLSDKIVIALISLQMDITDTCTILGINKNTMYRRRNTIKERLELDKSVDLEEWILSRIAEKLNEEEQSELIKIIFNETKTEHQIQ